ncbi:PH domain-containing protein [Streptomyces sp. ZYX-F-203]
MTTPEHQPPSPSPSRPGVRDRIYRSPAAILGGVLMLILALWLGVDAMVGGAGRTPWLAVAVLLLVVPPVTAYTLRPAVFAGEDRLRVRNPLRVIELPWGRVEMLRAGYSNEVTTTSGTTYQLWAIPVSLRARKRAARQEARRAADGPGASGRRRRGSDGPEGIAAGAVAGLGAPEPAPFRAPSDKIMDELREIHRARGRAAGAQGTVAVRWAYEIIVPMAAGAVLLPVVLLALD